MEQFTGKVWVLGDDIDTDIIIPTEYLALKTIDDMKQYGFSPLRPELAGQIQKGDIIVAGKNFGCGSSREQAPEVIQALGIKSIIAKSFARIFFRNAINNTLLLAETMNTDQCVGLWIKRTIKETAHKTCDQLFEEYDANVKEETLERISLVVNYNLVDTREYSDEYNEQEYS